MDGLVFNSDNGIITLALGMYIEAAEQGGGDQRLIDRATMLQHIFKNKSPEETYEWPEPHG